jgi:hypothetical protein
MRLLAALALTLTFALGLCAAASFYLVGGRVALLGPDVVEEWWPLIYALQALLAAGLLFMVARPLRHRLEAPGLVVVILAAWLGQWVVLASGVLADELNPANSTYYWMLATGGPLQPIAAVLGGLVGLRRDRRSTYSESGR